MIRRYVAVAAVVMVMLAVLVRGEYLDEATRKQSVTSFSNGPQGLSIFAQYAGEAGKGIGTLKKAILSQNDLNGSRVLVITSPRRHVTEHESTNIRAFVEQGGVLLLGLHDDVTKAMTAELLHELGVPAEIGTNGDFVNGETSPRKAVVDSLLLKQGEQFEFYSPLIFVDEVCEFNAIECFYRETALGSGHVIVMLGLPLFANSLLGLSDNINAAVRLASLPQLFIDEYHHFFMDKTAWDLWAEPRFIIPIGAIALVTLLFFMFGYSRLYELGVERPAVIQSRSFHDFGAAIVAKRLGSTESAVEALEYQAGVMQRMYPRFHDEIEKHKQMVLVNLHTNGTMKSIGAGLQQFAVFHRKIIKQIKGVAGDV